jgi:hypothetical protein
MKNASDAEGRLICPHCGNPILSGQSTVWPQDSFIHLDCWRATKASRDPAAVISQHPR